MDNKEDYAVGRAAFEAYCEIVGGVAYDGTPIPDWNSLSFVVKRAWLASARAAVAHEKVKKLREVFNVREEDGDGSLNNE